MRSMAITKNSPTPTDTVMIRSRLGTSETCSAKICKSGSATVIIMPITKLTNAISQILPDCARDIPSFPPKGSMDISAPKVNTESPTTRQHTPMRNIRSVPGVVGVRAKLSSATMAAIGRMERKDSENFAFNKFFNSAIPFPQIKYLPICCIISHRKKQPG